MSSPRRTPCTYQQVTQIGDQNLSPLLIWILIRVFTLHRITAIDVEDPQSMATYLEATASSRS
jgi:hypothetical protein